MTVNASSARELLDRTLGLTADLEVHASNGDVIGQLTGKGSLSSSIVKLIQYRESLLSAKRSLQAEIDVKLIDNYSVATKLLELSEVMTHALSRSLRVLKSLGHESNECISGADTMSTDSIGNIGSSSSGSGGGLSSPGHEMGQTLMVIMRKLRVCTQQEIFDAVTLLWKLLDGGEKVDMPLRSKDKDSGLTRPAIDLLHIDDYESKGRIRKHLVVREVTNVGALQLLLIALQKCQREAWVEAEVGIAKILSVLVAHESEDSQLLLDNAMNILRTLHTSLLSATDRDKIERRSRANSLVTLESRVGDSASAEIQAMTGKQCYTDTGEVCVDSSTPPVGGIPGALRQPHSKRQTSDSDETEESQQQETSVGEMHSTVAIALNRICAVLAKEWEKQDKEEASIIKNNSPKGSFSERSSAFGKSSNSVSQVGLPLSRQSSVGVSSGEMNSLPSTGPAYASSGLPLSRSNSGSSAVGGGGGSKRRSRSLIKAPSDALMDPNRTIDHIMRLVLAVCRRSESPMDGSSTVMSYSGTITSTIGNLGLGYSAGTNSGSSANSRPGSMKLPSSNNFAESGSNPNSHPNSRSGSVKETASFSRSDSLDREQPRISGNEALEDDTQTGIDNAAITCCDALLLLSSIPQCRTSLVSGGIALPLLRSWLDNCSALLSAELSWRIDMGIKFNAEEGPMLNLTRVLVTKVCAVLVNLMGGDGYADPFVSSPAIPGETGSYIGESTSSFTANGTMNDDMTGWIDSQLVSQGVAAGIIQLVSASVEDFTSTCPSDGILRERETPVSLLPRSVEIQLARILHHLCSRHIAQRRLLLTQGAPYTFCSLFVNAVKATRYVDTSLKRASKDSADKVTKGVVPPGHGEAQDHSGDLAKGDVDDNSSMDSNDTLFDGVNDNHEVYTEEQNLHYLMSVVSPCLDSLICFIIDTSSTYSAPGPAPSASDSRTGTAASSLGHAGAQRTDDREEKERREAEDANTPHLVRWMSSDGFIQSLQFGMCLLPQCRARLACLHVVSSLTAWPMSLRALFSGNVTDTLVHICYEDAEPEIRNRRASSSKRKSIFNGGEESNRPHLLRHASVDSAASSDLYLSSSHSSLSGSSPRKGEAAANISPPRFAYSSSTSAKIGSGDVGGNITHARGNISVSDHQASVGYETLPSLRRAMSVPDTEEPTPASDIMSIFYGINKSLRGSHKNESMSFKGGRDSVDQNAYSMRVSEQDLELEKQDPRAFTIRNVREETIIVCLALANICQHSSDYALRVYKNGLLSIMFKHAQSHNIEVKRQALRCISAMCEILPCQSGGSAKVAMGASGSSVENNNLILSSMPSASSSECKEALSVLTSVLSDLDDALSLLQKEAMTGIAWLAEKQEDGLLDSIFSGPLRDICGLMIDPNNERDIRLAAEMVLVKSGFSGGSADFQMCANDFQILTDWYHLRRSLKPQLIGNVLVEQWIKDLFKEADTVNSDDLGSSPARTTHRTSSPINSDSLGGSLFTPVATPGPTMYDTSGMRSSSSEKASIEATEGLSMDRNLASRHLSNELGDSPVKRGATSEAVGGLRGVRHSIKKQFAKGLEKAANLLGSGHKGGGGGGGGGNASISLVGEGEVYADRGSGSIDFNSSSQYGVGDTPTEGAPEKGIIAKVLPFCIRQDNDVSEGGSLPIYNRTPDSRNSPTAQILARFLGTPDAINHYRGGLSDILTGYFSGGLKASEEHPYPGLDAPPVIVWELLGHFFTSKLHKFLMLDLVSIGCGEEVSLGNGVGVGIPRLRGSFRGSTDSTNSPRTRDRYGMTPRSRTSSSRSGSSTKSAGVLSSRRNPSTSTPSERSSSGRTLEMKSSKSTISTACASSSESRLSGEKSDSTEAECDLPTATVVGVLGESDYDAVDKTDEDSDLSDIDIDVDFEPHSGMPGSCEYSSDKQQALMLSSTTSTSEDNTLYEHYMPSPHLIFGLMMPSRNYYHHSIQVMSRVVERMVSDGKPESIWAVIFRNSIFSADFHETFLASLRRTPQIVAVVIQVDYSLTNVYTNKNNLGGALGYLGGMLPSTIKWLSFDGALSKEGLQILCILLKKNNAAFLGPAGGASDVPIPSDSHDDSNDNVDLDSDDYTAELDASLKSKRFENLKNSRGYRAMRGLVGLAVTGCTSIDAEQMMYLCELISFVGGSSSSTERDNPKAQRKPSTRNDIQVYHGRGLKLMDLCNNRLSDSQCAELFDAACKGPLEHLDLGGNQIRRGLVFQEKFMDIFAKRGPDYTDTGDTGSAAAGAEKMKPHLNPDLPPKIDTIGLRLRHLGLSQNQLAREFVVTMLAPLHHNASLTSLDLSGNELHSSEKLDDAFRQLLKQNKNMRRLDLADNKLSSESSSPLHLGLLENETMLLINLSGNPLVTDESTRFHFLNIQNKLSENRLAYRDRIHTVKRDRKKAERAAKRSMIRLAKMNSKEENPVEVVAEVLSSLGPSSCVDSDAIGLDEAIESPLTQAVEKDDDGEGYAVSRHRAVSAPALGHSKKRLPIDEEYHIGINAAQGRRDEMRVITGTRAMSNFHDRVVGRVDRLAPAQSTAFTSGRETIRASSVSPRLTINPQAAGDFNDENSPLSPSSTGPDDGTLSFGKNGAQSSSTNLSLVADLESLSTGAHPAEGGLPTQPSEMTLATIASTYSDTTSVTHPGPQETLNVLFSAPLAWRDRNKNTNALQRLDYASERDALVEVFKEVHRDVSLCFDFATTEKMRDALSCGCRAMHFSGHGHPKSLYFEDGRGGLQIIDKDRLKGLLQAGSGGPLPLDFVFVAACHSHETGLAFVECGVKHVVAVKIDQMIQDSAAKAFTRAFYVALLSGKTVQQAFDIAREALKASPYVRDSVIEGDKFILLPEQREGTPPLHDAPIFTARSVGMWPAPGQCVYGAQSAVGASTEYAEQVQLSSSLARYPPPPPLDYEGREADMHRCITTIISKRLITLVGEEGLGKSALAAAVCTYIADRRMPLMRDGILFVRCEDANSHMSLLEKIKHELINSSALLSETKQTVRNRMAEMTTASSGVNVPGMAWDDTTWEDVDPYLGDDNYADGVFQVGRDREADEVKHCYRLEEAIISCLSSMHLLVVLDNIDTLLLENASAMDLKLFIGRLFERSPHIKVFIMASSSLGIQGIAKVVEACVTLGPLTLRNALRLYAKLAPPLVTAASKATFTARLTPDRQGQVNIYSRNLNITAGRILQALGNGFTAQVIKLACNSTAADVTNLLKLVNTSDEGITKILSHHYVSNVSSASFLSVGAEQTEQLQARETEVDDWRTGYT